MSNPFFREHPLSRFILAAILPPMVAAGGLAWLLLTLGTLGQAVLTAGVVPDPDLLLRMLGESGLIAFGLALPAGVLIGVAGGGHRLWENGEVLALASLGGGRIRLMAPCAALVVIVALAWAFQGHVAEPLAKASLRETRVAAAARIQPMEGKAVSLGAWSVALEGKELRFIGEGGVGSAREWSLAPTAGGVVATLADVEVRTLDGATVATMASLVVPMPIAGARVHVSERTTGALLGTKRSGAESWVLWKRTLLPLALVPLALSGLGLTTRGRPPVLVVAAQATTLWAAIRLTDHAMPSLGGPLAAALILSVSAVWATAAWRR